MDIITPIIALISEFIGLVSKNINTAGDLDNRGTSLKTALEELTEAREDLESQVNQAESLGLTCTNQVKGWLKRAEKLEFEVRLMVQRVDQQEQDTVLCCCANCCSRYKLSKKVLKKINITKEFMEKSKALDMNWVDGNVIVPVMEIPSGPVIGMDVMLEKVYELLDKEEVGIIGVYGMGGVGKTTLLKCINNEFLTLNHGFNVVIWVTVSREFVAEKIQQAIMSRLGLSWDEAEDQEQLASKIYKVLKMKKFLLLLDDIWRGVDLEKIGVPIPKKENNCKVILTSRSMDVCSDMDAHCKLKVDFLREKESWHLFAEKVRRDDILNSQSIQPHAQAIVKKCRGLPLALITIGKAMANKETEEEWIAAKEMLNKSPSELRGMKDVFTLLKFSYEELANDTFKSLLLYCSLFPEDCSIEKELLVEYMVGEGLLLSSHEMGHALIGSLKVACFLEKGDQETQVKMHDLVRSFVLWIALDNGDDDMKFLVQPSAGLTEAPSVEKWERAHRISLMDNEITELSEVPVCQHLSTLLLQWNRSLSKISGGFFQYMPVLKVLDLSYTSIREIPKSISYLCELRYLDLSGTKLSTLPKEMGSLKNLRYLDLKRTHYLRTIPREAISGLSQLRVLNLYYSYVGWEIQDLTIENEIRFVDLEKLRHLAALGITVTEVEALEELFVFKNCIQFLYITSCERLYKLHLSLNPGDGKRLRRLSINDCSDLQYLAIGSKAENNWLPRLEAFALNNLPSLIKVWEKAVTPGALQNLRSITIWYCNKLKNVSWVINLPKLEMLYLFYCKGMEEVINVDDVEAGGVANTFLSLRTLSMRDLPCLTSISRWKMDFPSLQKIAVIECPRLKKLPLKSPEVSAPQTFTLYGEKAWWDELEWDEVGAQSAFLPHFIPTGQTN
ncbi:hypothetical protein DCAR_0519635 [Daucus carota subsp. sativus]|uniref:AAA+ ATPase domain-containing protein n=1 Tax=Daucus carota subsp. sativus TaxID=79200 RepID=A0A162A210_DAUCS|nr:PREDICTED: disease resistance protein RPS2 [Daucus carota subsp. sativus]WOH00276.1 hypothetical protein DCAR_0519635 [Daucus carota subsp. sativus]